MGKSKKNRNKDMRSDRAYYDDYEYFPRKNRRKNHNHKNNDKKQYYKEFTDWDSL